jgi:hypothetical protein
VEQVTTGVLSFIQGESLSPPKHVRVGSWVAPQRQIKKSPSKRPANKSRVLCPFTTNNRVAILPLMQHTASNKKTKRTTVEAVFNAIQSRIVFRWRL